ncbi:MAG: 3'(2'),5'-bisphosphate nucleotidase CysQ [Candidatus Acidiferrales bacterium]
MNPASTSQILRRIQEALEKAVDAISPFIPGAMRVEFKLRNDPVTEADRVANNVLRDVLVRDGEGWLSEESADDLTRLEKTRVWVVDPIDGTREFVAGVPEWCVSVGLIENGLAIAGGISNPATGETFLGSLETGVTYNGNRASASRRKTLNGATVLASRNEVKRGEWERFRNGPFAIRSMGSVAYKLALVAAGLADATWTLCPKHEWDVAAGVALVNAAGGFAQELNNSFLTFNNKFCLLPNLLAGGPYLSGQLSSYLLPHSDATQRARAFNPLLGRAVLRQEACTFESVIREEVKDTSWQGRRPR